MSNEYKFNIGQNVTYKGFEHTQLFVIGREQIECYAGVQNYYTCRHLTVYKNDRQNIAKFENTAIKLCEVELEDISKMIDRLERTDTVSTGTVGA